MRLVPAIALRFRGMLNFFLLANRNYLNKTHIKASRAREIL